LGADFGSVSPVIRIHKKHGLGRAKLAVK